MLCVLCPPDIDPHPFADHLARKEAVRDRTVDVLMTHTIKAGVMASMGHWAYHHPDGQWFTHCGTGWADEPGCGWTSEPHCYPTKEEARRAGMMHLAEKIQEARRG